MVNILKENKSATMNIFDFFYFLFKSFIKGELSYDLTINLFTIAENCMEKWITRGIWKVLSMVFLSR